jgi:putative PEP-CTERM system TPR-repeat lipoprotein
MNTMRTVVQRLALCAVIALGFVAGCTGGSMEQRLERAAAQHAAGEHRAAAIELQNVLQDEPGNIRASLLLGSVWLAVGDIEAARQRFTAARDLGASAEEFAVPLADALIQSERLAEARTELDRISPAGRGADWYTVEGELQLADGAPSAADAAFRQAAALDPAAYDAYVGRARTAALAADWPRVFEYADTAVAVDGERHEAYLARAEAQMRSGNVAAAATDFQQAADVLQQGEPSAVEASVLIALAQAQLTLNQIDNLQATAARVQSRLPDSPATTYIGGLGDFGGGRYREATAKLQQASSAASSDPLLPLLLGLAHLELGNLGQAENHLLDALERRPGNVNTVRALADVRRRQGRLDAALEALDRAGDTEDPTILSARGVLYLETRQPELAVVALQRAAVASGDADSGLRLLLARAYLETGRLQEAEALFDSGFGGSARPALEIVTRLLAGVASDGGLDATRASAQRLLEERPNDANALFGVALFNQAVGANEEALALFQRAAAADASFTPPRLAMAGLALAAGETERARSQFQSVVVSDPAEFRAWLGLAQMASSAGSTDEARRFAERAAAAAPQELAPRLMLAQLALAAGDEAGADAPLAAARAMAPDDPDVATLSARLALSQQRVDVALAELERAANAEPGNVERWHRLGRLQLGSGDFAAARVSLRRAADLAPRNAAARFDLGQAEAALGDASAARLIARELQADFPEVDLGYVLEGDLLAAAADHQGAARLFERAYEQRPSFELAGRAHQARLAARMNDVVTPIERWLERTPEDARAWLLLAQAHESAGRTDAALAAYERVIALQPQNVIALNNAAWIHNESGSETALTYAQRAVAAAPSAPQVLDTYGWVLLSRGDVAAAVTELRKAATGAADAPDIQYHFAAALARQGETTEARRVLESILAEQREFSSREQAQALLAEL